MSPSNPFSRLRTRINERLESVPARQRLLIVSISAGVLFLGLLMVAYAAYDRIDTLEQDNDAMLRALRDIEKKRSAYVGAKAREQALDARLGQGTLQLSGFAEQIAKEVGIKIGESNPRNPEALGKKYIQQSVDLRISKVGLEPLLRFIRRMETYQSNLVMVTALAIRARDDKRQDFEVGMTLSTYERAPKPVKKAGKGDGKSTSTGQESNSADKDAP